MKAKRRILATICVFLVTVMIMTVLTACTETIQNIVRKNSAKEFYSFSAVTSATMLSSALNESASADVAETSVSSEPKMAEEKQKGRPTEVQADIGQLNEYIKMFEGYLVGNGVNEVVSKPTEEDLEYKDYAVKSTTEVPRMDGGKERYTMYYTEFDPKTDTEIEFDEEDGQEEKEVTISTRLEGVMLYGANVYPVSGGKEVEVEDGETETEVYFRTELKDGGDRNYISVRQETELDEVFYEYTVVKDGKTITKTKIEIEKEEKNGAVAEEEVKLTFIDKSGEVPERNTYWFNREVENGKTYIKIKYNSLRNPAGIIRVTVDKNGNYDYKYENGYEEKLD